MGDLKKTFLAGFAVLLILLIAPYYLQLIGYNEAVEYEPSESQKEQPLDSPRQVQVAADNPIVPDLSVIKSSDSKNLNPVTHNVVSPLFQLTLSNAGGGSITSYQLSNTQQFLGGYNQEGFYQTSEGATLISAEGCTPCVGINTASDESFILSNNDWSLKSINASIQNYSGHNITLSATDSVRFEFNYVFKDVEIIKETTFYGDSFSSQHNVSVQSPDKIITNVFLVWDGGINNTEQNLTDELTYSSGSISVNDNIETMTFSPGDITEKFDEGLTRSGKINWASIRNKYFIAAFIPQDAERVVLDAYPNMLGDNPVPVYTASLFSSQNILSTEIFLGPLDIDYINNLNTTLDRIMNFGWFIIQPFSRGVLWLLKTLHSTGLNYGIILILFAFIVRIVTGPLTKRAFESSQKMQSVQPQLKKLQEKYKNDSKKLNQEMMKLYRDNSVNPVGGCLPMLLQMPLLFSLFLVFRSTIEFRGAPFFGWISNLSQPDTIFNLPFYIPIYGDQVAFLPLLLGISMFLTQKMSMASMDSQQKPMMYMMSAFFFLIFNSFPSGLNLYYLFYNILNYLQQRSLKKS